MVPRRRSQAPRRDERRELFRILRQQEQKLRDSLGIPEDAERVLIIAETSHWDPNWLHTSEVYYRRFVERTLDHAIAYLERESRRIYSLESVFFLRMYWEKRPEQRRRIKSLIRDGRLRMSSPAVSTADTIIPRPEAILRDFLLGQEWLRARGLEVESKLAYFPDSFGASPALPSLLRAAGFSHTAISRVDGMYFPGFELNLKSRYPQPGSTAELLLKKARSLDFIWRDRAGAKVLAHWNAFSYFQGDLLAHRGFSRNYLFPVAVSDRSERNIARRIRRYVDQLDPLSPTAYMFCPIGIDFISPIPDLVALLDRYNRMRYPETGTWAINAGLDDYLNLVEFHRDLLPEIELDPNPYWSGFYTSRPALKDRCHDLLDRILIAERLTFQPENDTTASQLSKDLESTLWTAAVSNHHDFITGTSPDPTVEGEQIPWLETGRARADAAISQLNGKDNNHRRRAENRMPVWSRRGEVLTVETDNYLVGLDAGSGGAIVRAVDRTNGHDLLTGPSNDLISYYGSGGLWRMGHEFPGGAWKVSGVASVDPAKLEVEELPEGLMISWTSTLNGEQFQRSARFAADSPIIRFRIIGRAAKGHTLVASFAAELAADRLVMDVPGGVVSRPCEKLGSPTFWPFQHFLHVRSKAGNRGLAVFQRRPGAASFGRNGSLELVAMRNATRERAYRWLPVSGNPAEGYEADRYTFDYAIAFTGSGDWAENGLPGTAYSLLQDGWAGPLSEAIDHLSERILSLDRNDVWVLANKPASRGPGRIIRLYTHTAHGQEVTLSVDPHGLAAAYLCDARERDIRQLELQDGSARLPMPGSIATLRLII